MSRKLIDNKLVQVRLDQAVGQNEVQPSDKSKTSEPGYLLSISREINAMIEGGNEPKGQTSSGQVVKWSSGVSVASPRRPVDP